MAGYQRQATANIQPDLLINAADLNSEYDAIDAAFNASTGHTHSGSPGEGAKISLTASVSGILPIANGGTNATTASAARTNLGLGTAATQNTGSSGNNIPFLDGTNTWSNAQTFNGNLTLGTNIAISFAGTGAATTRTNLGLGTLAVLSPSGTANSGTYLRGDNTWAALPASGVTSVGITVPTGFSVSGSPVTTTGTFGVTYTAGYEGFTTALKNSIGTSVQTSGAQTIAGVKTFSNKPIMNAGISLGSNQAITFAGTGAATTRTNLGVAYGTTAGTVAEGNDSRIVTAVPNTRTISAGTGLTGGGDLSANRSLAVSYGTTAGTAAQGNDSRITGALPKSGGTMTGDLDMDGNKLLNVDWSDAVGNTAGTLAAGDDPRLIDDPLSFAAQSLTPLQQAQVHTNLDTATEIGKLALGVGQTWQDVTGSRARDTAYQNTTGKPIMIAIFSGSSLSKEVQASVDGTSWVVIGNINSTYYMSAYNIIPDGHYYRVGGSTVIGKWAELR